MAAPMVDIKCSKNTDQNLQETPKHGSRTFYEIPKEINQQKARLNYFSNRKSNGKLLLKYIDENVLGNDASFAGPFGERRVTYCDYIASGRSLNFIEDYIREQVLPVYGNTHTTTTVTSLQTTLYRHEARDIIRNAVKASEHDAVIFVGTGCTAAVHKLINALNLSIPPVVFVGPFEHHSTFLPWREVGAKVVRISQNSQGEVNMGHLQEELEKWKSSGRQLIGCFSAASNITGIELDTDVITACLHQHDALALWDYATAGPYIKIDMNPVTSNSGLACKDAIFLSLHKFVGGVETPGVLIAKKKLFRNPVPTDGGGGGSVFFVTRENHRYLQQIEMREEGGTPSIVGAIRAGMVFQLKEAVGAELIMEKEHQLSKKALNAWKTCKNLVLLGNTSSTRLPIFSFLIRQPNTGQFLHHNFICAVLNDVFGIQARGGCACAGPYAQDLLGIDEELADEIEAMLLEDSRLDRTHLRRYQEYSEREILRPGFARINLPYFMSDDTVEFVIAAVAMVADEAWKLLPQYMFNPETGEWKQRDHQVFRDRRWLGSISYSTGNLSYPKPPTPKNKGRSPENYKDCLQLASEIFNATVNIDLPDQSLLFDEKAESIRWFMLPSEAVQVLQDPSSFRVKALPFNPPIYSESIVLTESIDILIESDVKTSKIDRESPVVERTSNYSYKDAETKMCSPVEERELAFTDKVLLSDTNDFSLKEAADADKCTKGAEKRNCSSQVDNIPSVVKASNDSFFKGMQRNMSSVVVQRVSSDLYAEDVGRKMDSLDFKRVLAPAEAVSTEEAEGNDKHTEEAEKISSSQVLSSIVEASNDTYIKDIERNVSSENHLLHLANKACNDDSQVSVTYGEFSCDGPISAKRTNQESSNTMFLNSTDNKHKDAIPSISCNILKENKEVNKLTSQPLIICPLIKQKPSKIQQKQQKQCSKKKKRVDGKIRFHPPPKCIFKPTIEALEEYNMIQQNDKILVCLSGGKDSLSLLHTLKQYQYYAKKKNLEFCLGAVTVDPQTSTYDPSPLKGYLAELGVPYFYEEQCIMEQAASLPECTSICSFCSRMKRGRIYAAARREGYNVLAMGQHLDDLAESFFMSVFHNGLLRTMKANYVVKEGDLRVIRPFVYVREKDLRDFAEEMCLPVIAENCPACFEAPKERHRTKQLLATQELLFPRLYQSLATAMKPLMAKSRTGLESTRNYIDDDRNKKSDEEEDVI